MTLSFMRQEIFEQIGEPDDIDPDTDVQYDGAPLLDFAVNEGLRQVSTWKNPSTDRTIRLPEFIGEMTFQSYYETGTLTNVGTTSTVVLPTGASTVNDAYNGWIVTVGSETRFIVDYVGASLTATVTPVFGTAPAVDDTFKLAKNFNLLLASTDDLAGFHITLPASGAYHKGNMLIPLKVIDIANTKDLTKAKDTEAYSGIITQTGTPSEWLWLRNSLIFNFVPNERLWYKMEYYRLPKVLTTGTDEPDIPEFLQYGVILWGRWWGYSRQQAAPEAYSAKRDFQDFMAQRLDLYSMEYLREDDYGTLRMR